MSNDTIIEYLIDSKYRSYGTSSNFNIQFDDSIKNASKAYLQYFNFPNTYYNVKNGYNKIDFNEGAGELNATLTSGNYSINDLQTEIKTQMEAVGVNTYTVTYSSVSMKLTITSSGNFTLLNSTGTNSSDKFKYMIGFDNNDSSSSLSHTGPFTVDLFKYLKYFKVRIPQFGLNGKLNKNGNYTFIITNETNRGQYNTYDTGNNFQQCSISQKELNNIDVMITDEDNNIIDMNGGEIFFVITIS